MNDIFGPTELPRREHVCFGDVDYRLGDRVRLQPSRNADALDLVLFGKTATIAAIEQDFENRIYLSVTIDEDPGRDIGMAGLPGHRFFFFLDEVSPLDPTEEVL